MEFESCGRCGRKLKGQKSRDRGYGSVCWKKVKADLEKDVEHAGTNDSERIPQEN